VLIAPINNDPFNDVIVGVDGGQNIIYTSDGSSQLDQWHRINFGTSGDHTVAIAVDMMQGPNDGKRDLVVANRGEQSAVYLQQQPTPGSPDNVFNQGPLQCSQSGVRCFGSAQDLTESVATAELTGDGEREIIAGVNVTSGGSEAGTSKLVVYGNFPSSPTSSDRRYQKLDETPSAPGSYARIETTKIGGTTYVLAIRNAPSDATSQIPMCALELYRLDKPTPTTFSFDRFSIDSDPPSPCTATDMAIGELNGIDGLAVVIGNGRASNSGGSDDGNQPGGIVVRSVVVQGNDFSINSGALIISQAGRVQAVTLADVNNDQKNDIVAISGGDEGRGTIYFNRDPRNFEFTRALNGAAGALDVAVGELTRPADSAALYPEIVTVGATHSVYINPIQILDSHTSMQSVAVGQLSRGVTDASDGIVMARPGALPIYYTPAADGTAQVPSAFGLSIGGTITPSLALAQINGDGAADAVIAGYGDQGRIFFNQGSGFKQSASSDCANPPADMRCFGAASAKTLSLDLGDVDGEGTPDIAAIVEQVKDTSTIYTAIVYLGAGGQTANVAYPHDAADLNCDPTPPGQDDPPLPPPSVLCVFLGSEKPATIRLANIDGQHGRDLVVGIEDGGVHVFLHTGDAATPRTAYAQDHDCENDNIRCFADSGKLQSVAVGAFNADIYDDIVVGNDHAQSRVYRNSGPSDQHRFGTSISFGGSNDPTESVEVTQFPTSDTLPDIVVGNNDSRNAIYIGGPREPNDPLVGLPSYPESLDCAQSDVICASFLGPVARASFVRLSGNQPAMVMVNAGQPSILERLTPWIGQEFAQAPNQLRSITTGDLNNDGAIDLVVGVASGQSAVYLNDGNGNFPQNKLISFGSSTASADSIAVGDINRDGLLDVIAGVFGGQSKVYLNRRSATNPPSYDFALTDDCTNLRIRCFGGMDDQTTSIALGYVNNDGWLDIVVGNRQMPGKVYFNQGAAGFRYGALTRLAWCDDPSQPVRCFGSDTATTSSVALAQIDNDGKLDIIAGSGSGRSRVYLQFEGKFARSADELACEPPPPQGQLPPPLRVRCFGEGALPVRSLAVGDMNGDGLMDVVTSTRLTTTINFLGIPFEAPLGDQIRVYLNTGAETSQDPQQPTPSFNFTGCTPFTELPSFFDGTAYRLALADMDGDGALDILAGDDSAQSYVYLQNSDTEFGTGPCALEDNQAATTQVEFGASSFRAAAVVAADLDRTTGLDIATISGPASNTQSTAFLNNGVGQFGPAEDATILPSHVQSVSIGDLDNANGLDLLAVGQNNSQLLLKDGTGALIPSLKLSAGGKRGVIGSLYSDTPANIDTFPDVAILGESSLALFFDPLRNPGPDPRGASLTISLPPNASSLLLADVDEDDLLDIIVGTASGGLIFSNNSGAPGAFALDSAGAGDCNEITTSVCQFGAGLNITSLAAADMDSDGDLDLVLGVDGSQSLVLLKGPQGGYTPAPDCDEPDVRCFGDTHDKTLKLAQADLDRRNGPDLVVLNEEREVLIYLNRGGAQFYTGAVECADPPADVICLDARDSPNDRIFGLALVDLDGNLTRDIIISREGTTIPSKVYLNHPRQDLRPNFDAVRSIGMEALPDALAFAVGDISGDGAPDFVAANFAEEPDSTLYVVRNALRSTGGLPNTPPRVTIEDPRVALSSSVVSANKVRASGTDIPINFWLFDDESDPIRQISVSYSLDGGANWAAAKPNKTTQVANLATLPRGIRHTFFWDTAGDANYSRFFGQSDSVLVRIVASPGTPMLAPDLAPIGCPPAATCEPRATAQVAQQRPTASAETLPFSARGTIVYIDIPKMPAAPKRAKSTVYIPVVRNGSSWPLLLPIDANQRSLALVYRLPKNQVRGGLPLGRTSNSDGFHPNKLGFLRGSARLNNEDKLVALVPVYTGPDDKYTLYYTSAAPNQTGLAMKPVQSAGIQRLIVTQQNALLLFHLKVSLEWDARQDKEFLDRLNSNLQKTSELLFEWSNGQVALGDITIDHQKTNWDEADVQIYASNRLRPNADQGGITGGSLSDPDKVNLIYQPGRLRIGSVWNRFGGSTVDSSDDWPRALAHEMGHYLLYLDDSYLGLKANQIVPIEGCPTPMSNPYRADYDEFHTLTTWRNNQACTTTLPAQTTGRSDWGTILRFYPWLSSKPAGAGPSALPIAVTRITPGKSDLPLDVLPNQTFTLVDATSNGLATSGDNARAYLYPKNGDKRIVALGRPGLNSVRTYGARRGDTVCVYEVYNSAPPQAQEALATRLGCAVAGDSDVIRLVTPKSWLPALLAKPDTVRRMILTLPAGGTGVSQGTFSVELFGSDGTVRTTQLTRNAQNVFTGKIEVSGGPNSLLPASGHIRYCWVPPTASTCAQGTARREMLTDYALGGGPVSRLVGGGGAPLYGRDAPATSSDGDVMLFWNGPAFGANQLLTLQSVAAGPLAPSWVTQVGKIYYLSSLNVDARANLSISFNYLQREVPQDQERWLTVYYWDSNPSLCQPRAAPCWRPLPTQRPQGNDLDIVSAPAQGEGFYTLMSSVEIELKRGWNKLAYTVEGCPTVENALASIDPFYLTIYWYNPEQPQKPYLIWDRSLPPDKRSLKRLEFGRGYDIFVDRDVTVRLKPAKCGL
jgi:hypothetical protein